MSRATFFIRECPTCGRRLQIRVEYLGRTVRCKHCEASSRPRDPSASPAPVGSGRVVTGACQSVAGIV